jgi:hypothetical protein
MKTLEKALETVRGWHSHGCVGHITIFSAPRSTGVDMIGEQTIKLRELKSDIADTVKKLFDQLDAEKIELFLGKDGKPDRIKIVRRF